MPVHPPPQLEQHLLPDPAGALQEEHPAGGLDQHHPAQHADDDHQRVRRAAGQDRRDAVVDAALHEKRNRKARNVFHHDDERKQRDRQTVGPQQRAEQRTGLAAARQAFVDGQVVALARP